MDWRPVLGEPAAPPDGGSADWRSQLHADARQMIVNQIMDTLKRHLPISVPDGLTELQKIAVRFEEKIYSAASNQIKSQHYGPINLRSDQGVPVIASDGGGCSTNRTIVIKHQIRLKTVNSIMDFLKMHVPISMPEDLNELQKIAIQFEEEIYTSAIKSILI